jgi:hypothetical protein
MVINRVEAVTEEVHRLTEGRTEAEVEAEEEEIMTTVNSTTSTRLAVMAMAAKPMPPTTVHRIAVTI